MSGNAMLDGVAGVDEAGRGPLIGPVVAAAVLLGCHHGVSGIKDSKKLSESQRFALEQSIKSACAGWSLGIASASEIDEYNILRATMLAMNRAIETLPVRPLKVLVDGNRCPESRYPIASVIRGDASHVQISAASILAKCARDRMMIALDKEYPQYGFARHKGYPTRFHLAAIRNHGLLPDYRKTFGPVAALLATQKAEIHS